MAIHFEIIPMRDTHTKTVCEIEKQCFGKHGWSEQSIAYQLTNDCAFFFCAVSDEGNVLGYCGSHIVLDECYTDNIAVFPQWQNNGIGKALTQKLIDNAKAKNCAFISLEVRPSNQKAVGLYEQLGFKTVGRRKNFYSSPTEDGLIMTLYF